MLFKKKLIRRRPYVRRARARVGRRRSSVSAGVKKYVKQIVNRTEENKVVSINQVLAFGNIFESPDLNLYPLLPYAGYTVIGQGVNAGSRIGNKCQVMKVLLKYCIYANAYDAVSNAIPVPCEVQLFLLNLKQAQGTFPSNTQLNGIVQLGASSTNLQGNLADVAINSWNKDVFNIHKVWRHKVGYSQITGTGSQAANEYFANNDFKMNVIKTIDCTKYVAKFMSFDDSGTTHLGKNCFFGFQALNASGGTMGATAAPMKIQYWIDIVYQDA